MSEYETLTETYHAIYDIKDAARDGLLNPDADHVRVAAYVALKGVGNLMRTLGYAPPERTDGQGRPLNAPETCDTAVSTHRAHDSAQAWETGTQPSIPGTEGQDRESYGDIQDRVDYTPSFWPAPEGARCAECNELFTRDEWDDRHSRYDGEDIHARCCPCGENDD